MTEKLTITITIHDDGDGPELNCTFDTENIRKVEMALLTRTFVDLLKSNLEANFNVASDIAGLAVKLSECVCQNDE